MKKLIIIIGIIALSFSVRSQTIQNVSFSRIDTIVGVTYGTTQYQSINVNKDSLKPEFTSFETMCKSLSTYSDYTRVVIQNTDKESGDMGLRILVIKDNQDTKFLNYNSLSSTNKNTYNNFIIKCKTFIK